MKKDHRAMTKEMTKMH